MGCWALFICAVTCERTAQPVQVRGIGPGGGLDRPGGLGLAVERGLRPGGGSATIGAGAHGEPSELGSILVGVGDYSVRVPRVGIWC